MTAKQFTLRNMPKGFFPIYFIQLFSTASFAVLYSTLVLYMKLKLGLSAVEATAITGVYFAYNFALHLLSGTIAGRLFSYRDLVALGLVFQLIGCLFLSMGSITSLYLGLALMLIGTGTMVTCINMMLSQLFEPEDTRREYAFFWNYSGMNIGFVLGFTVAGVFQLNQNYHVLFIITALTNVIGLSLLLTYWKALKDRDTDLSKLNSRQKTIRFMYGCILILMLVPTLFILLHHVDISDDLVLFTGAAVFLFLAKTAFQYDRPTRNKIFVFLCLQLFALIFWVIYQIAPMGLTLFAQYNVDRHLWGHLIAPAWIQNINSITIIVGGPLLALLFRWFRNQTSVDINIPLQFSLGILLAGIGLLLLPLGIHYASVLGYVAFSWIFAIYVLQAIAELCIGPIGYSMIGLLAPPKLQSIMMGTVLLYSGVASVLASYFSNYALGHSTSTSPLVTDPGYSHAFLQLGIITVLAAIVLFIIGPRMMRFMGKNTRL